MRCPFLSHFLLFLSIILLAGCAVAGNANSYQFRGERVAITPVEATEDRGILAVPALGAIAPQVITFAARKLEAFYARESEKYVARYGATYVGEDFYREDGSMVYTYSAFAIDRFVHDGSGQEVPASSITLAMRANEERTLLQFLPQEIQLSKAKAKLRTGDNTVDLNVNIVLNAFWQVKNGEVRSKELGDVNLVLTGIRLGETYSLRGEPNGWYLENSHGEPGNYNVQSAWLAPVPISVSEQGNPLEHARGNYSLDVTVTEVDDYGERVARFGQDLNDGRGILIELLEQVVD